MTAPSQKQIDFIRSLVAERQVALTETRPAWLKAPESIKDASAIIALLKAVPRDPVAVDESLSKQVNELRALLGNLDTRDAGFAVSLIRQFDERGSLSDKQTPYIATFIAKATNPSKPIDVGLYLLDGNVIKVYLTQNKRLGAKRLVPQGNGKGAFVYAKGVLGHLTDAHRLTEEQAREFGKQHGFCVACARSLDDDRSLAVGYGATCASNHGWFYPTLQQASEILGRPANHVCQWERTSTETIQSNYTLGTWSVAHTYTCSECGKTEARHEVKNYSGD